MKNNPVENPVIKQLLERKSMRVYEQEPMPEEDVRAILAAAVQAPTAGNMTLWTAIRVTDEEKKRRLVISCDNQPFIATAPPARPATATVALVVPVVVTLMDCLGLMFLLAMFASPRMEASASPWK